MTRAVRRTRQLLPENRSCGNLSLSPKMIDRIYTIGHSTHPIEVFLDLLDAYGVRAIADVRLLPGSRRHPQFNRDALETALRGRGIRYQHLPELGGRRKPRPDSKNTIWRNDAFRGYADHMETAEFAAGIEHLRELNREAGPVALMCAELLWWKCHRRLIADFLKARGTEVIHILGPQKTQPHERLVDLRI